jgi:hypothetical protein
VKSGDPQSPLGSVRSIRVVLPFSNTIYLVRLLAIAIGDKAYLANFIGNVC